MTYSGRRLPSRIHWWALAGADWMLPWDCLWLPLRTATLFLTEHDEVCLWWDLTRTARLAPWWIWPLEATANAEGLRMETSGYGYGTAAGMPL